MVFKSMVKRFSTLDIGLSQKDLDAEIEAAMKDFSATDGSNNAIIDSAANFSQGAILKGRVVRIAGDDIVVDIGYKIGRAHV